MQRQCETEATESEDERLLEWRTRIVAVLSKSAYKDVAEDAADDIICKMLRRARGGQASLHAL